MMASSRVLRKRKHEEEADDTDKNKKGQSSKRTKEDHTVTKQPNKPSAPGQSPIPVRSDIDVTTRLRSVKFIKRKSVPAPDQSHRPDVSDLDTAFCETESRSEIDVLRNRIRELEEERNDYHDSLRKETEKAMDRGRQLLLLQAREVTAKQRENSSRTTRHRPSLERQYEDTDGAFRHAEATRQHEPPTGQQFHLGGTRVLDQRPLSSSSVLEHELQKHVDDMSTRLSEAETEIEQRVSQVLRLFRYKSQDEQFAAQSRLMRTEDCKIAQALEEPKKSNDVKLLRETNHDLSEKLQKQFSAEAKLQAELRELHASLEESVRSRDEVAVAFRDASQSHSREKVKLEERIRNLESEMAQMRLEIEQLDEKKTSIESLECKNKQLQAENGSLANDLSEVKPQLRAAESKISLLETAIQNLDTRLWRARTKHMEDMTALETRVKEISESLTKATTEAAKQDEELSILRAAYMEKERALDKAQDDLESIAETLDATMFAASEDEVEISRLRHFEQAVTEHDRAVKRLEKDREEILRQQQEQLGSLTEAQKQLVTQKEHNEELQMRNEALELGARESEATKREHQDRITQFLRSVDAQLGRQIEEPGGDLETSTEITGPDDATLKQLEDRLQKKLDMIEHELKWYKDNRAKVYDEYRRLDQWRNEMASNVAAWLRKTT